MITFNLTLMQPVQPVRMVQYFYGPQSPCASWAISLTAYRVPDV